MVKYLTDYDIEWLHASLERWRDGEWGDSSFIAALRTKHDRHRRSGQRATTSNDGWLIKSLA